MTRPPAVRPGRCGVSGRLTGGGDLCNNDLTLAGVDGAFRSDGEPNADSQPISVCPKCARR